MSKSIRIPVKWWHDLIITSIWRCFISSAFSKDDLKQCPKDMFIPAIPASWSPWSPRSLLQGSDLPKANLREAIRPRKQLCPKRLWRPLSFLCLSFWVRNGLPQNCSGFWKDRTYQENRLRNHPIHPKSPNCPTSSQISKIIFWHSKIIQRPQKTPVFPLFANWFSSFGFCQPKRQLVPSWPQVIRRRLLPRQGPWP